MRIAIAGLNGTRSKARYTKGSVLVRLKVFFEQVFLQRVGQVVDDAVDVVAALA